MFAADHGVAARGVSAYPAEVTAQMVANMRAGGAAVNVLARAIGAALSVVDVGVGEPTADMTDGPAMTRAEAERVIAAGQTVARGLIESGVDVVAVGEMGIGNTTAASALTAALTGLDAALVTSRGTGLDDAGVARKVAVVRAALERNQPDPRDPIAVLAAVGGREIGALVGLMVELAAARIPVVLDGFITGAAALVGAGLAPKSAVTTDRRPPLDRARPPHPARPARTAPGPRSRPPARRGEWRGARDSDPRCRHPAARGDGDVRRGGRLGSGHTDLRAGVTLHFALLSPETCR